MSYSTYTATWPGAQRPQLRPTAVKLCTGEQIQVKGAIPVRVHYGHQDLHLTLIIVDKCGPTLLGRDWLQHLKIDWPSLCQINVDTPSELKSLIDSHSALFSEGLGQIKGVQAKLYLKEASKPQFFRARQVPYAF